MVDARTPVFTSQAQPARQVDFQFPNLALAPTSFLFRKPLIGRPAAAVRPVDFQPINLVISAAVVLPSAAAWGPWPKASPPPQDWLPANIVLTAPVVVPSLAQVRPPVFTRSPVASGSLVKQDFQFPNLILSLLPPPPPTPPGAYTVSGKYVSCNYGVSGQGTLFGFSDVVNPFATVVAETDR